VPDVPRLLSLPPQPAADASRAGSAHRGPALSSIARPATPAIGCGVASSSLAERREPESGCGGAQPTILAIDRSYNPEVSCLTAPVGNIAFVPNLGGTDKHQDQASLVGECRNLAAECRLLGSKDSRPAADFRAHTDGARCYGPKPRSRQLIGPNMLWMYSYGLSLGSILSLSVTIRTLPRNLAGCDEQLLTQAGCGERDEGALLCRSRTRRRQNQMDWNG